MPVLHIVGVDPGLVHTGCVRILIDTGSKSLTVEHAVLPGDQPRAAAEWVHLQAAPRIFVEKYNPRSHFDTDERMVQGEKELNAQLKGEFLRNTGIKTIVTPSILGVLKLTKFATASHHQDLLSAARIAVLGMMKDEELNEVLATIVRDHLDGNTWLVIHA